MAITNYLLNHGKTSAQKLAEVFEASPRTIMRDMDTLNQAGIPIQSFYGVEGGYQIIDTFVMEKQLATGNDIRIIEPQSVIERILETCNQLKKEYEE